MRVLYTVFLLLIVLIGLSFAMENSHSVEFHYYVGSVQTPLAWLLVLTLLAGAVLGMIASLGVILRLRAELRRLRKQVAVAQEEVRNLRAIPIRNAP